VDAVVRHARRADGRSQHSAWHRPRTPRRTTHARAAWPPPQI